MNISAVERDIATHKIGQNRIGKCSPIQENVLKSSIYHAERKIDSQCSSNIPNAKRLRYDVPIGSLYISSGVDSAANSSDELEPIGGESEWTSWSQPSIRQVNPCNILLQSQLTVKKIAYSNE